ncbi:MAG: hypothetical protein KDA61_04990, partial [Planctomycetales bacterium]|nr:hypothetical protein [Planctomycetales bacterium]
MGAQAVSLSRRTDDVDSYGVVHLHRPTNSSDAMPATIPAEAQLRTVALVIETSNAYARGLLEGVTAFQRQHGGWSVYVSEQDRRCRPPSWLRKWAGDGMIARVETESVAAEIAQLKAPVVDVSSAQLVEGIPCVKTND